MLYLALLRKVSKSREGQIESTLMNGSSLTLPRIQHKVVLLVLRNCISRRFLITQFLVTEVGKNTLADKTCIVWRQFSSICASAFTNALSSHFKVKFDQLFVQRLLRSRLISNM